MTSDDDVDVLGIYLRQIHKLKRTTHADHVALAATIKRGGKDAEVARKKFIEGNLKLVVSVAKRYQFLSVPLLDLIQEGNTGLMRAVSDYDSSQGCQFSTYATWWIRQAITTYLSDKSRLIRIPRHIAEKLKPVATIRSSLLLLHGREPTAAEILKEIDTDGVTLKTIEHAVNQLVHFRPKSLDEPLGGNADDPGGGTRYDLCHFEEHADDGFDALSDVSPEEDFLRQETSRVVFLVVSQLPAHEANIVSLRFGMNGNEEHTLEQASLKIKKRSQDTGHITRERVRQIEHKALGKLRKSRVLKAHRK